MNSCRFHEQSVLRTLRVTSGPELVEGFDCGLFRPPLRASLESLDFARDPEHVEGRVRSTLSKPATKIFVCLQELIHEFKEFVNYAG